MLGAVFAQLRPVLFGGGGGTGDFVVSRHVSKQIAIAQKLYARVGGGG